MFVSSAYRGNWVEEDLLWFSHFLFQKYHDHLIASEKQNQLQWEDFMKEQPRRRAEVDEEHRRAMERLKEQYAEMEKGLAKFSTF